MPETSIVSKATKNESSLGSFFLSEFRNSKLALAIISILGFFLMFILAFTPTIDPDFGWHIKTGELMWEYKTIPYTDWYSYTMPDFAWINHEWLTEIFMYQVSQMAGPWALNVFFTLLVVFVFGFLIGETALVKPRWENRILLGVLAIFVNMAYIGARPQMFTLLFVALVLLIIKFLIKNEKTKAVWFLPPLFLLWVNMHASFLAGFLILGIYLLTEKIKIGRLEKRGENEWIKKDHTMTGTAWKKLFIASALSLPMIFLNPYSYRILIELKRTFTDPFAPNFIVEWLSPNFHQTPGLLFLFLVFLLIEILFLSKKKINPTQFILITIFMWLAFQANRHIPLFTLILLPFLLETINAVPETITLGVLKNKFISLSLVLFFALFAVQFSSLSSSIAMLLDRKSFASLNGLPENALKFLSANPQQGNMFNDYGWGGYIISGNVKCRQRSLPQIEFSKTKTSAVECSPKVFIDGRMAHWKTKDREILKEYADIYSMPDNFDELIEKYDISWVLVQKGSFMGRMLKLTPGWDDIYEDDLAIILRKVD